MMNSMSEPICYCFRVGSAKSSKITTFGGHPCYHFHSRGIPSLSVTKFSHKKLEIPRSWGGNQKSLSNLSMIRYQTVTDRRTDTKTELR